MDQLVASFRATDMNHAAISMSAHVNVDVDSSAVVVVAAAVQRKLCLKRFNLAERVLTLSVSILCDRFKFESECAKFKRGGWPV